MKSHKYTGIVLYEGPSLLNGEPIVAIATLSSQNVKTGDMIQTWILPANEAPYAATKSGADAAVCGECPHRHHTGGACYVIPWQGPGRVYKSWKDGKYPNANRRLINRLMGRPVRFGSYGDPAAVPSSVWKPLLDVASFTTGYTHQPVSAGGEHMNYLMASADSEEQASHYQQKGLRTFRVKSAGDPLMANEIVCPASRSEEIQCIDCGLCSGALKDGPNIAIDVHGQRAKRYDLIDVQVA